MPHIITHKNSKGTAAHGRHEIRALEDVGRSTGGIQYRTQTGAQAELALPTATDFLLGNDGTRPTWVSATQVATATQPVLSFLYTVTASATKMLISWASVATQFSRYDVELYGIMTATPGFLAARFSTDGVTVDTATNRNFWTAFTVYNTNNPAGDPFGSTATNAASQAMLCGTDNKFQNLAGIISIWPSSESGSIFPSIEWQVGFYGTESSAGNINRRVKSSGSAHYWPAVDINGISLFPVFGAASFDGGFARVYGKV